MKSKLAADILEACNCSAIPYYEKILEALLYQFEHRLLYQSDRGIRSGQSIKDVGRELHSFFIKLKPNRYSKKSYLLPDLLDSYVSEDPNAQGANCKALTAFYNILADELGIPVFWLNVDNHFLSRIEYGGEKVNVEHTLENGFDMHEARLSDGRRIDYDSLHSLDNSRLVAEFYIISAERAYHHGDLETAWELNEKAGTLHQSPAQSRLKTQLRRVLFY